MNEMTRVDQLMTSSPMTADRRDLVGPIREQMLETGVHCLPVVDATGHPVGIVSSWDLVEEYLSIESIDEVMTSNVITIGSHQNVYEAAVIMQCNFIHHLVVINEENEVLGVLSSLDLLGEFIDDEVLEGGGESLIANG
jgi:signal-transduction protein with cAMP-binding, CBS, and nucleotidyltransferase domain